MLVSALSASQVSAVITCFFTFVFLNCKEAKKEICFLNPITFYKFSFSPGVLCESEMQHDDYVLSAGSKLMFGLESKSETTYSLPNFLKDLNKLLHKYQNILYI